MTPAEQHHFNFHNFPMADCAMAECRRAARQQRRGRLAPLPPPATD